MRVPGVDVVPVVLARRGPAVVPVALFVGPVAAAQGVDLAGAALSAGIVASILTLAALGWYFGPRWIWMSRKANPDIFDDEWRVNRWPTYRLVFAVVIGGAWALTVALAIIASFAAPG